MKMSSMMKSTAVLLAVSVAATTAFAGPQKQEQVPPKGERYAYVWVTGSRIPQRVKISPIGTPTFNALSIWDRASGEELFGRVRREAHDALRRPFERDAPPVTIDYSNCKRGKDMTTEQRG